MYGVWRVMCGVWRVACTTVYIDLLIVIYYSRDSNVSYINQLIIIKSLYADKIWKSMKAGELDEHERNIIAWQIKMEQEKKTTV